MKKWENNELKELGTLEEIKLSALKKDGSFYNPVIIWVVRVGNDLYVRSYKGMEGSWYQHIQLNDKGRISAEGITREVNFAVVSEKEKALHDKIDQEYRSKYQKYGKNYIDPMISLKARTTTIRLVPN